MIDDLKGVKGLYWLQGVAKARSVLSSYVDPALKDEKEEKNDEKIKE